MKLWIIILFLGIGLVGGAQEVEHNGIKYEVKGDAIFKDGKDVTSTLSLEKQQEIKTILKRTKATAMEAAAAAEKEAIANKAAKDAERAAVKIEKERKDAEKALKQAEKAQKKAEKEQRKAEKALKKKQDAQDAFAKASKRLSKNQAKYDKLKRKGKLSPNDEIDWLKKLKKYREDVADAQEKLSRS